MQQAGIQVVNSARQGSVTGPLVGSSGSGATSSTNSLFGGTTAIVAYPNGGSGPTSASKLSVGPGFLSGLYTAGLKQVFGPYWVVAAGECPASTVLLLCRNACLTRAPACIHDAHPCQSKLGLSSLAKLHDLKRHFQQKAAVRLIG